MATALDHISTPEGRRPIIENLHRVFASGAVWSKYLSPVFHIGDGVKKAPQPIDLRLSDVQELVLDLLCEKGVASPGELSETAGVPSNRLRTELAYMVRQGWLNHVLTKRTNYLYTITLEGRQAAITPRPAERRKPTGNKAVKAPEPHPACNPEDMVFTGTRYIPVSDLPQLSGEVEIVVPAKSQVEAPKKLKRKPGVGRPRAAKDPALDPRRAEIVRLYHAGHNMEDMKGILRMGSATLKRIMALEELPCRPSCVRPKQAPHE